MPVDLTQGLEIMNTIIEKQGVLLNEIINLQELVLKAKNVALVTPEHQETVMIESPAPKPANDTQDVLGQLKKRIDKKTNLLIKILTAKNKGKRNSATSSRDAVLFTFQKIDDFLGSHLKALQKK